jgi:hypothetical protein
MSALSNPAIEVSPPAEELAGADSPARTSVSPPPRELWHSEADIALYARESFGYLAAVHVALVCSLLGWLPLWLMAPIVMVALPRFHLALHELMHMRTASQVNPFTWLNFHFDTPISLGYHEYRTVHIDHHRHPATEQDPEWYQIRGGHLRALVAAMFTSELACFHWVKKHGVDRQLAIGMAIRLVLFSLAFWFNPGVFLVYLLVLRTTMWSSQYVFHHVLHYRNGQYGTFRLVLPKPVYAIAGLWMGKRNVSIVCEHVAHHAWPQVRASALSKVST